MSIVKLPFDTLSGIKNETMDGDSMVLELLAPFATHYELNSINRFNNVSATVRFCDRHIHRLKGGADSGIKTDLCLAVAMVDTLKLMSESGYFRHSGCVKRVCTPSMYAIFTIVRDLVSDYWAYLLESGTEFSEMSRGAKKVRFETASSMASLWDTMASDVWRAPGFAIRIDTEHNLGHILYTGERRADADYSRDFSKACFEVVMDLTTGMEVDTLVWNPIKRSYDPRGQINDPVMVRVAEGWFEAERDQVESSDGFVKVSDNDYVLRELCTEAFDLTTGSSVYVHTDFLGDRVLQYCDYHDRYELGESEDDFSRYYDSDGDYLTMCSSTALNMVHDGDMLVCDGCGSYFMGHGRYCHDCRDTHGAINSYSYKPTPIMHGEGDRFFGFELEVDNEDRSGCGEELAEAIENLYGDSLLYCKSDGSLNDGVEIVSHPMTLEYLYGMDLESLEDMIESNSLYAESTCGFHVHVNRDSFGDSVTEQEMNIAKLIHLCDRMQSDLFKWSNRNRDELERWATFSSVGLDCDDDEDECSGKYEDLRRNVGRYRAINIMNRSTVEFRLWASSCEPDTIRGYVELTNALAQCAIDMSVKDVCEIDRDGFVEKILSYAVDEHVMKLAMGV